MAILTQHKYIKQSNGTFTLVYTKSASLAAISVITKKARHAWVPTIQWAL